MFRLVELTEPSWWQSLLTWLNHVVSGNATLFHTATILADIFVFAYPILLVVLFVYGRKHKRIHYQHQSLQILSSVAVATMITILIQQLIRKDRPESLPGLQLILAHVPTISFPSDHATVSMAIAVGTMLVRRHNKSRYSGGTKYIPRALLVCSLIMGIARVAVAIHRPSDIAAWRIIGIVWGVWGRYLYNNSYIQQKTKQCITQINSIIDRIVSATGVTSK